MFVDFKGSYAELDRLQRECAEGVRTGRPGRIFMVELDPVITLGKRSQSCDRANDIWASESDLQSKGIALYCTDRGGLATYHGPGQWVIFPVESVDRLVGRRAAVREVVRQLLLTAKDVCDAYGETVELREGEETGLWGKHGKIASVGIRVWRGIILHGLSLNVFPTETSFYGLNPCGKPTSIQYLLEKKATREDFRRVGELLKKRMVSRFPLLRADVVSQTSNDIQIGRVLGDADLSVPAHVERDQVLHTHRI